MAPAHRLYACTTCARDVQRPLGEPSQGAQLANAIGQALDAARLGPSLNFYRVACLGGCLRPCNIALRAPRKFGLRFSRLQAEDAGAVVEAVTAYCASTLGEPARIAIPASLRTRLTATTPPPHLLFAS